METFKKLANLLKKKYPEYKIDIRCVPIKDYGRWKLLDIKSKHYLIQISKNSSDGEKIDAILHEFSHVLTANKTYENESEHHAAWGQTYAKLYRIYEENFLNE